MVGVGPTTRVLAKMTVEQSAFCDHYMPLCTLYMQYTCPAADNELSRLCISIIQMIAASMMHYNDITVIQSFDFDYI